MRAPLKSKAVVEPPQIKFLGPDESVYLFGEERFKGCSISIHSICSPIWAKELNLFSCSVLREKRSTFSINRIWSKRCWSPAKQNCERDVGSTASSKPCEMDC